AVREPGPVQKGAAKAAVLPSAWARGLHSHAPSAQKPRLQALCRQFLGTQAATLGEAVLA
ncbi:hypothetical protein IWW50_006288, partial [Coemansia erecta]